MNENKIQIPEGWEKVDLRSILKYEQPYKYSVTSTNYNKSGTPVLTAGKSFILGYTTEKKGIYNNLPVIIFDDFTTDSKFVNFPFKVKSSAMKFLKEKQNGKISLKLLFEIIYQLKLSSIGGDHKRRWISDFSKRKILLPKSTKEQQKIAEILSKVDKAIEQTESLITKYQGIKTGLMQDLLTKGIDENGNIRSEETHEFKDSELGRIPKEWDCLTINDIAERLRSGVTPRGGSNVYQKEGVMLIRSQNIYPYGFKNNDVAFISEEINNRMKGSELKTFDVLLNITGASIGRSTFIPIGFPNSNVNQHVCSIRLKKSSLEMAIYLSSYLNSIYGQNQIMQNNAGSNREGINYTQIREIKLPYFNNENELLHFYKLINKSTVRIQTEQTKLQKLQKIKTALMQDLLSGKKRVSTLLTKAQTV
ncbi:MAG: restriction endonuclease subunit S [Bacteroidales bacterium]|nr:restriction endonuclease subunit S [Bacteroidales bacterium]